MATQLCEETVFEGETHEVASADSMWTRETCQPEKTVPLAADFLKIPSTTTSWKTSFSRLVSSNSVVDDVEHVPRAEVEILDDFIETVSLKADSLMFSSTTASSKASFSSLASSIFMVDDIEHLPRAEVEIRDDFTENTAANLLCRC